MSFKPGLAGRNEATCPGTLALAYELIKDRPQLEPEARTSRSSCIYSFFSM